VPFLSDPFCDLNLLKFTHKQDKKQVIFFRLVIFYFNPDSSRHKESKIFSRLCWEKRKDGKLG
jgi:hypothetical protein